MQIKIELCAYIDGLFELRNMCYYLETDTNDVTFKVARRVEEFTTKFPEGTMMYLPSTERLIMQVSSVVVIYFITLID